MLVLTRRPTSAARRQGAWPCPAPAKHPHPRAVLRTVAVGLGTVQLLLDAGRIRAARETLLAVRDELQVLRRSAWPA